MRRTYSFEQFSCWCQIVEIQNMTKSQRLHFSELHRDKGSLSQQDTSLASGESATKKKWETLRATSAENRPWIFVKWQKGDRPVEARLVDFVWRSRQSLGRGLAIFHRSRFDAAPPAAFLAKSAAATLLILFLSLLHYQGEGGLFWYIWVLPLKNWNS